MREISKQITLKKNFDGTLERLFTLTSADNVLMDNGITLKQHLADTFGKYATAEEMTAAIQEAMDKLIDGAPEALDTLREVAEWVEEHEELYEGFVESLANKVDKIDGKGLSQEDYTTAEKQKLSGVEPGAQVNTVSSVAGRAGAVTLTKADVGLGSVDNTSDLNKPVSDAVRAALENLQRQIDVFDPDDITDMRAQIQEIIETLEDHNLDDLTGSISNLTNTVAGYKEGMDSHVENTSNPHNTSKAQVGLGSVDNTSDVNKPISAATQTALNNKVDAAGAGLIKDGTVLKHSNSIAAGSVGPDHGVVLGFGDDFDIPGFLFDSEGHIKSANNYNYKLPALEGKSAVTVKVGSDIISAAADVPVSLETITKTGTKLAVQANSITSTYVDCLEISGSFAFKDNRPDISKEITVQLLNGTVVVHSVTVPVNSHITPIIYNAATVNSIRIITNGSWADMTSDKDNYLTLKEI